jgi:hypothetical protein
MPEKTVQRRLRDCDPALASDASYSLGPSPSWSRRSSARSRRELKTRERKKEALPLGRELLRGTKYEEEAPRAGYSAC